MPPLLALRHDQAEAFLGLVEACAWLHRGRTLRPALQGATLPFGSRLLSRDTGA